MNVKNLSEALCDRILSLPTELRWMIYENIVEPQFVRCIGKEINLWFQGVLVPGGLISSKELDDSLDDFIRRYSVQDTIIWRPSPTWDHTHGDFRSFCSLLALGYQYDRHYVAKYPTAQEAPNEVCKFSLGMALQYYIRYTNQTRKGRGLKPLAQTSIDHLKDMYTSIMLFLRRKPELNIAIFVTETWLNETMESSWYRRSPKISLFCDVDDDIVKSPSRGQDYAPIKLKFTLLSENSDVEDRLRSIAPDRPWRVDLSAIKWRVATEKELVILTEKT